MSSQSNLADDANQFRQARRRRQREEALDVDTTPYGPSQPSTPDDTADGDTTCQNCRSQVSRQFVRVFGANDGRVHACLDCVTERELYEGAGAREGYEPDEGHR